METAWHKGVLAVSEEIVRLPPSSGGGSCSCCSLCHQFPECASFSFSDRYRKCILFRSVASYASLTPNEDWGYFVMPGRSQHQQFCRSDSDCQQAGDFCRGGVCTELTTVNCRTIFSTFGAGDRYSGERKWRYGWLNQQELPLVCKVLEWHEGSTSIFRNTRGFIFNDTTLWSLTRDKDEYGLPFSILSLADEIHRVGSTNTSSLFITYRSHGRVSRLKMHVTRDQAVVGSGPRFLAGITADEQMGDSSRSWRLGLPYTPANGPALLTINFDETENEWSGALAGRDGVFWTWLGDTNYVNIWLRE